jgi:hypothetical protein
MAPSLGAGQHGNGLHQLRVGGQRTVVGAVDPQNVRERHRVGVVAFGPRDGVALPVSGNCQRIDRLDRAAGGAQTGDQQAAAGLNRDRDLRAGVSP